ncbi:MAG TPA: hypothetical protein VLG13_02835 [Patescibacteria group bacterium]|nr:hypothetical protein [Patescibacteria group bacterium]
MKHHVIYVPGITDDTFRVQSLLLLTWWLYGVRPHLHVIPWAGDEAFAPKLQRLLDKVDGLHAQGHTLSLVGASAGASAVLNAYIQRKDKISGLVYICGKINHPESVSERTYSENPAFKESLGRLPETLAQLTPEDKAKMLSLYSPVDTSVPYPDTIIGGVAEKRLPRLRHGWAIVYAISLGAFGLIKFLK